MICIRPTKTYSQLKVSTLHSYFWFIKILWQIFCSDIFLENIKYEKISVSSILITCDWNKTKLQRYTKSLQIIFDLKIRSKFEELVRKYLWRASVWSKFSLSSFRKKILWHSRHREILSLIMINRERQISVDVLAT